MDVKQKQLDLVKQAKDGKFCRSCMWWNGDRQLEKVTLGRCTSGNSVQDNIGGCRNWREPAEVIAGAGSI